MERKCTKCDIISDNFRKHRKVCRKCESENSLKYFHEKYKAPTYKKKVLDRIKEDRRKYPSRYIFKAAKIRAKKKGIEFNLNEDDVIVPKYCPVLGIELFVSEKQCDNSPTLDRIDNSKGYIKGNIEVISWRANNLKSDGSFKEIKLLFEWLSNYNR